jgi:hypothetical protein
MYVFRYIDSQTKLFRVRCPLQGFQMSTLKNGLLSVAAIAALVSFGAAAGATTLAQTFVQTSDDSSNQTVGTNSANTVTVTDNGAGTLDILVTLASGWGLINSGAGNGSSFVFGLSGISSLNFGAVNPTTFLDPPPTPPTWYPTGATVPTAVSTVDDVASASLSAPGKFVFSSGYGLTYTSNGGSNPFTGLEFTITESGGLTLATFLADLQSSTSASSTGLCTAPSSGCFYADVTNGNGNTGLIDFGLTATTNLLSTTPLPATLPLFATGFAGLGLLGWRRKRKNAAAIAA